MKKTYATILAAVAAAALTAGCEQQQPGPAEKVGKQIDQAVEKAGEKTKAAVETAEQKTKAAMETAEQKTKAAVETAEQKTATAVEKTQDYTGEKMKEAGQALEQAGEKLQK
jgi:predicted small secreted protein